MYFFSAQESQPVYATNYFYINPTTGDITLTSNLRGDPNTPQYQVKKKWWFNLLSINFLNAEDIAINKKYHDILKFIILKKESI